MELTDTLTEQFNHHVSLRKIRPNIQQLLVPLYHEDGDMVDIFLDANVGGETVRICDHGMTLMRLSYTYDINTPSRERILEKILSENGIKSQNGNLMVDARVEDLYPAILQFAQAIAKVSSMRVHTKEMVKSMFYEFLSEAIRENLEGYAYETHVTPLDQHQEFDVDFVIETPRRPIYLYGVNNSDKARLVTISCQAFLLSELKFTSWVVHENFDELGNKDRSFLTNAVSKQFTNLDHFKSDSKRFLLNEAV